MNTGQCVKADERTAAVAFAANTWGLNFITFALLIDVMYRSFFLHEAAWDLIAMIIVSGAISMVYMARHNALGHLQVILFGRKQVILLATVALVSAVVAVIVTIIKSK